MHWLKSFETKLHKQLTICVNRINTLVIKLIHKTQNHGEMCRIGRNQRENRMSKI